MLREEVESRRQGLMGESHFALSNPNMLTLFWLALYVNAQYRIFNLHIKALLHDNSLCPTMLNSRRDTTGSRRRVRATSW